MIKCPMCTALCEETAKECRKCKADLKLLTEYVLDLKDGLSKADALTRNGDLGEAVWAYLTVLEVDPDNATARRQVGKVVTAVRQFDRTAPARRWLNDMRQESFWQRLFGGGDDPEGNGGWAWAFLMLALLFLSVGVAYYYGVQVGKATPPEMPLADDGDKKPARDK